jgi:type III pantothenate kinase
LPLLEPVDFPDLIGRDTFGSIQSGVVNGMLAEIEGLVAQYQQILSPFDAGLLPEVTLRSF